MKKAYILKDTKLMYAIQQNHGHELNQVHISYFLADYVWKKKVKKSQSCPD